MEFPCQRREVAMTQLAWLRLSGGLGSQNVFAAMA